MGSLKQNGYGLHDVAGNAWKWCADCTIATLHYVILQDPVQVSGVFCVEEVGSTIRTSCVWGIASLILPGMATTAPLVFVVCQDYLWRSSDRTRPIVDPISQYFKGSSVGGRFFIDAILQGMDLNPQFL